MPKTRAYLVGVADKRVVIKFKTYNVASKANREAAFRRARKKYKSYRPTAAYFSPTLKGYIVALKKRRK